MSRGQSGGGLPIRSSYTTRWDTTHSLRKAVGTAIERAGTTRRDSTAIADSQDALNPSQGASSRRTSRKNAVISTARRSGPSSQFEMTRPEALPFVSGKSLMAATLY